MKKLFALLLVVVMAVSCFALASCGDKEESSAVSTESAASTDASVDASTDASADESADASTDASADESADASTDASADESADASTDVAPSDITETASYKYVMSIDQTKGFTFSLNVEAEGYSIKSKVCAFNNMYYSESEAVIGDMSSVSKELVKDGKEYYFDVENKTYTVSEVTMEEESFIETIFADVEYVNTTTEEIDGVTYTVDNFKTISGDEDAKFYVNAEGVIEYAFMDGMVVGFELVEGVIEGCFDIPADYTEAELDFDIDVDIAE